jgi:hypothetical protein
MSSTHPGAPAAMGRDRQIALIRVAPSEERAAQAMQLLESMLWAFKGTLRSNWVVAPSVDSADIVVVHDSTRDERISHWRSSGKPVVIIASSADVAPPGEHVLVYPFRAAQVLQLLNSIDTRLNDPTPLEHKPEAAEGTSSTTSAPALSTTLSEPNPWLFVQTLRTLREVENASVWLTARLRQTPVLWVKGDGREYCTDVNTLQAIRQGKLVLSTLALRKGTAPESHRTMRPSTELEWFAGYHAADYLAPWLDADARFRITRWPNFGLIRPLPSQIRLAALLGTKALTIEELMSRVKVTRTEVVRTLNALDVCDLLAVVTQAAPKAALPEKPAPALPAQASQAAGGVRNLLRLMRKRLGLSEI